MSNWLHHIEDRNSKGQVIGTSQDDRKLPALLPTHFGIDESDQLSFVRFLRRYSGLIAFWDNENHLMGSWREMLDKSPLLGMLSFNARDVALFAEVFHTEVENLLAKSHATGQNLTEMMSGSEPVRMVCEMLLEIGKLSQETKAAEALQRELMVIIRQNLAPVCGQLGSLARKLPDAARTLLEETIAELPSEWSLDVYATHKEDAYDLAKVPATRVLTVIFTDLLQIVYLIRASVDHHIQGEVLGGAVKPHVATFMGFFEMMKVAYGELNRFTERHLDYYFQDLLSIKPRPASPDRCHVVFTLAENCNSLTLEAGTALTAGQDAAGNPRIYRLERNIALNKAKIAALKALVHDTVPPLQALLPGSPIRTDTYAINTEPLVDPELIAALEPLDSFYAPGLAIASALWHVEPTHALLKMTLTCDLRSFEAFELKVRHEWNARHRRRLNDTVSPAEKNSLICDLFTASYTIDGGQWHMLPSTQVELCLLSTPDGASRPVMELRVLLQPGDPMVMPCLDPGFPEAVAKGLPVFRFLVAKSMLHRYQWFNEIVIHTVELEASVLDVRSLVLQNDFGLLDPNVPFQPFGPLPTLGSNFYVGHPRLFNYPLDALKINIEWFGLPTEKEGFAQVYADYGFDGDNHSFMAVLSILDRKNWWPKQQKQLLKLFQSVSSDQKRTVPNPRDRVSKIRRINEIDLDSIRLPHGSPNLPLLAYDKETLRGFLRLQLAEPIMAFGHQLYPEILTRQITESTRKKKPLPTPSPPYTPTIKSISIDYASTVKFSLNARESKHEELFYHIHPFGVMCMDGQIGRIPISLLPQYEQGGHLYIGIEGLQPQQPVSFLFNISDEGALDYEQPLEIIWSYLSGGHWIDLDKSEQLFDTTLSLTKTGVIGFQIEELIDADDSLLPGALTWLRCRSNIGTKFLTQLLNVHIQATICSFSDQGNRLDHLEKGLPPGTINALLVPNGSIAAVEQPYPSTEGRPAESPQEYYRRVSELLRHKGRAVTHWDYEHLVLEHFPEVRKVVCLSHVDQFGKTSPGKLLVTVIPKTKDSDRARGKVTRISDGRIQEIHAFLSARASTFAHIIVTNPVVEQVKVSVGIKLKAGFEDRNYYLGKLNQDLRNMLSPWYFSDDISAGMTAKIYAARVIEFLDHQYYVDYVTNFKLLHLVNGQIRNSHSDFGEYVVLRPLQPHAILISVEQHALSVIVDETPGEPGIGGMITQIDLTVPLPEPAEDGIEHEAVGRDLTIPGDPVPVQTGFRIQFKKSTL